ncbi:MAG: phospho-N-acetylmuramoyl-pentapeptide-transferase [Candidatus Hydrogenedentes bacterium]|nr:phospho-N-acetylmuramoyl-pentapeptide-transferase [Candidatus Hydrogenedentota bacterium]
MLYYLAMQLVPLFGPFNVFAYHTVRAGGAAVTAFLFCIFFGPAIIRLLTSLKIGQYIRKEHVSDLHELHKGKAGTPTMGGAMIILATLLALLLWSTLANRLLWLAVFVFCALGVVGFIDDYTKLRRKRNEGLSARAKFIGQIATGAVLGVYLVVKPITVGAMDVAPNDVRDWPGLVNALAAGAAAPADSPNGRVWEWLDEEAQQAVRGALGQLRMTDTQERAIIRGLDRLLDQPDFYEPTVWAGREMSEELASLAGRDAASLERPELLRRNRMLLETALPAQLVGSGSDLHTKINVPGFKNLLIPLGFFYLFFVIFVIVSISNAVNLTDGLDGLAAGVSIISLMAYTGIAYIVSRSDWSHYLYLTYVPEAVELFVFGAAILGAGLGFLWFNAHPAEIFMGDTGSLALGGALGTMAILTKQELLLPIVAGLFVLEALSVLVQVASFKLTGRRVFRMAPLHHHFELLGWSETKVTMRFYIIAILFAIMSMGTLKLR